MKRKNPLLVLDPGHGGKDPGAGSGMLDGKYEKDFVLEWVLEIEKRLLSRYHVDILLTRRTDVFIELIDRSLVANDNNADFFLSVHINAGYGGYGYEDFIMLDSPETSPAGLMRNEFHSEYARKVIIKHNVRDRGKKTKDLSVLRNTKCPAMLTENLFIDHVDDQKLLLNPGVVDSIIEAHVEGIARAMKLVPVTQVSKRSVRVSKNLFNGRSYAGYFTTGSVVSLLTLGDGKACTTGWIPCKGNTKYTISGNDRQRWQYMDSLGNLIAGTDAATVTTPVKASYFRVYYSGMGDSQNVQIEEGLAPTSYVPYAETEEVKRPVLKAKKNLIPSFLSSDWSLHADFKVKSAYQGSLEAAGLWKASTVIVPVEPTTEYTFTMSKGQYCKIQSLNPAGTVLINHADGVYAAKITFTSGLSASHVKVILMNNTIGTHEFENVQLEKGSVATQYEPIELVGRKAKINRNALR